MSSMPALAMISASPSFWQVMPCAPAASCIFASIGLLCVLICGRLATPATSHAFWIREMLRSTRSISMEAQGVPYSRAILAARGVVMEVQPLSNRERRRKRSVFHSRRITFRLYPIAGKNRKLQRYYLAALGAALGFGKSVFFAAAGLCA